MKTAKLIFLLLGSYVVSTAASANYGCAGKVSYLGADYNLHISNGYGIHRICALTEERCKIWLTLATSAKLADRQITIYYSHATIGGDQNGSGRCSQLGNWVAPADPVYFVQLD